MSETLALVVTRSCNLECSYCPVAKTDAHLDSRSARDAVRMLAGRGGGLVRLTGGEPTLNWKTVTAVLDEVGRQRDSGCPITVELCTNGTGLDGPRIARLDRTWIRVVLSLDGMPATQQASGRPTVENLGDLVGLPGFTVTQTIAPGLSGLVLDNFLFLWEAGIRSFNLLPVYYVPWSGREVRNLGEGLAAVASFLSPRVKRGEVEVRNLTRSGSVPLFNDDLTLDADGTWYRTNLVLADAITHPLLDDLGAESIEGVPARVRGLRRRLEALLEPGVRRSNHRVDAALDRFVSLLSNAPPRGRPERRGERVRPERLEFHISYACTNSCTFCSEAHRIERWRDHPVTAMEVHRTLVSHARAGGSHVNLTGGEPSLHPAFVYALELARSLSMRTFVGTNGAGLADPGLAARAVPLLDELSLSLHGPDDAMHDRMTGRRGSFRDLMETLGNARRLNPRLEIFANCVVTRTNWNRVPDVLELCATLEIPTLILSNAAPEGRALDRYPRLAVPLERWRGASPGLARDAERLGVTIRFFGLPMCALGEARMKSNDLHWDPRVTVERARGPHGSVRLSNVAALKPRRGRKYTRRCRGCIMREVCGGVFTTYVESFGDEEIRAIRG